MARNESEREDLMSEAVSLVRRIECRCPSRAEPATVGFNALGWLFFYMGNDPMYRYDELGRLRRAFVDGFLYRTAGATLAKMERRRVVESGQHDATPETVLIRRDLSAIELESFRQRMRTELEECLAGIRLGGMTRQSPHDDSTIVTDIEQRIRSILDSSEFLAPAIVRR